MKLKNKNLLLKIILMIAALLITMILNSCKTPAATSTEDRSLMKPRVTFYHGDDMVFYDIEPYKDFAEWTVIIRGESGQLLATSVFKNVQDLEIFGTPISEYGRFYVQLTTIPLMWEAKISEGCDCLQLLRKVPVPDIEFYNQPDKN